MCKWIVVMVVVVAVALGWGTKNAWYVDEGVAQLQEMKAIISPAKGSVELMSTPLPVPGYNQVLVKVAYAPVNPSDVYHALADYQAPNTPTKTYPLATGLEGSGTVVASGGGILAHAYAAMGARVAFASADGGSWAEYAVVDAMGVLPLPDDVTLRAGSAALVNPMTVVGFLEVAHAGGHTAMVHTAANSALGLMLLKAARKENITVVAVVRGEHNVKKLTEEEGHPTDLVIQSDTENFAARLKTAVEKNGATLAFDAVSGEFSQQIYDAMPTTSEVFVYGMLSGSPPPEALTALNDHKQKPFKGFHVKNWLDEGGLPRVVQVISHVRSMLANELSTQFAHELDLVSESALTQIYDYFGHQKGGKTVFRAGGE